MAARTRPTTPQITAATAHSLLDPLMLPDSRAIRPRSDWLPDHAVNPVRPPWKNKPWNHHLTEAWRWTMKPTSTVNTNPAVATPAWGYFRASSRYGMNTSGVSLMPAATPTPKPFHHRLRAVSGWVRSQMIRAIRTRLTCPRYRVRMTGSVQNTRPAASRVAPARTIRLE